MISFSWAGIEATAAAITAIYPFYIGAKHTLAHFRKKRDDRHKAILKQATEEVAKVKAELEEKLKSLRDDLDAQKERVSVELEHIREIYNSEIRVLGEKIETLRQDIQIGHQSLVALLTKLVNSK